MMLETITIVCDADGCLAMHEGTRERARGHALSAVWRSAHAEGWKVRLRNRHQVWACPAHSAALDDGDAVGAAA